MEKEKKRLQDIMAKGKEDTAFALPQNTPASLDSDVSKEIDPYQEGKVYENLTEDK